MRADFKRRDQPVMRHMLSRQPRRADPPADRRHKSSIIPGSGFAGWFSGGRFRQCIYPKHERLHLDKLEQEITSRSYRQWFSFVLGSPAPKTVHVIAETSKHLQAASRFECLMLLNRG